MMNDYREFKLRLFRDRPKRCPYCGYRTREPDCHHAVVSRNDVRGFPTSARKQIHDARNCLLVHHSPCHGYLDSQRILGVAICIAMHGWDDVEAFVGSLGFEVPYSWHRGLTESQALAVVEEQFPWV